MDENMFLQESHNPIISPMPSNYYNYSSNSVFLVSSLHSSHTTASNSTFPITAVAIIGILATAFLLVSYYIFVIKCCLNWHRIDILRRFSFSGRRQQQHPSLMNHFPSVDENRGLDEAIIRSIPILQYKKLDGRRRKKSTSLCECAVCLNEFQEEDKLRVIPNCGHAFHIDCIDIWLQNNANCPLCRTSISAEIIVSPNFSRDEDFVVIEISQENDRNRSLLEVEERFMDCCGDGNGMIEQKTSQKWKKKLSNCVGDECIDIRHKDDQFGNIQPIRRSFSMDSASDPQLHLAVQLILQQQQVTVNNSTSKDQGSSSSSSKVVRRSFFSFGHDRTSRSAILPLHLEP